MYEIRRAELYELESVLTFYSELIDGMSNTAFNNIWKHGAYPEDDFIRSFIKNGNLYLMIDDTEIISSMGLNNSLDGYDDVKWKVNAKQDEIMVIHIIGVSPRHMGEGHSVQMVDFAIKKARETGMKTIRLDVLPGNIPAKKAYIKNGFSYVTTRKLHYGDSGIRDFELYEYVL